MLDGNDKGGIDGNGQVWYNYAKGFGNKAGRPMSLAIQGAKNVVIKNFSIIQPQFWVSAFPSIHLIISGAVVVGRVELG